MLERVKKGTGVLQFMEGEFYWMLTYLADSFFLEKYNAKSKELVGVECIDEDTAAFSLTARY